jgi:hypothetical protein
LSLAALNMFSRGKFLKRPFLSFFLIKNYTREGSNLDITFRFDINPTDF